MLGAIRAAGFVRVGFEAMAMQVKDDRVEGSFLVRPLHEIYQDSTEPATMLTTGWTNWTDWPS